MCSEPFEFETRKPIKLQACCGVAICSVCVLLNLTVIPLKPLPECPSCNEKISETPQVIDDSILASIKPAPKKKRKNKKKKQPDTSSELDQSICSESSEASQVVSTFGDKPSFDSMESSIGSELAVIEGTKNKKSRGVKMNRKPKNMGKGAILSMTSTGVQNFALVMRGSNHGFTKEAFKSRVIDKNLAPLIILVRSENGNIFCGQTTVPWRYCKPAVWHADKDAHLLSLTHTTKHDIY